MQAYFSEHLTLISRGILSSSLAGNYMFKVNYKNNRASSEICSYVVGVALSLFLTLNTFHTLSGVFIVNFEKANAGWEIDDIADAYLELYQTFMMELFYVNIFIFSTTSITHAKSPYNTFWSR